MLLLLGCCFVVDCLLFVVCFVLLLLFVVFLFFWGCLFGVCLLLLFCFFVVVVFFVVVFFFLGGGFAAVNDAFYLRLYVEHMVKDNAKGSPLPPLVSVHCKGSFIQTIPQTGWYIPLDGMKNSSVGPP